MKSVIFDKPVNLNLLAEELFERFPEWRHPRPNGRMLTDVSVGKTEVIFPDSTDEADVLEVIAAHDARGDSKNDKKKKDKEKHRKNAIKKLKELGLSNEEIDSIIQA